MTGADQGMGAAAGPAPQRHGASPKLLECLVCPATGGQLTLDPGTGELVSKAAHLAYPIRSGMPIMLIDEARRLSDD